MFTQFLLLWRLADLSDDSFLRGGRTNNGRGSDTRERTWTLALPPPLNPLFPWFCLVSPFLALERLFHRFIVPLDGGPLPFSAVPGVTRFAVSFKDCCWFDTSIVFGCGKLSGFCFDYGHGVGRLVTLCFFTGLEICSVDLLRESRHLGILFSSVP